MVTDLPVARSLRLANSSLWGVDKRDHLDDLGPRAFLQPDQHVRVAERRPGWRLEAARHFLVRQVVHRSERHRVRDCVFGPTVCVRSTPCGCTP